MSRHSIRNPLTLAMRFAQRVGEHTATGCLLWQGAHDNRGYGRLYDEHGRFWFAHRAAWFLANGTLPDDLWICHTCDVPQCVAIAHLFIGTPADNAADMTRKGRGRVGVRNGAAELTAKQVIAIRVRYARGGISQRSLARMYGVGVATICNILTRRSWQHI